MSDATPTRPAVGQPMSHLWSKLAPWTQIDDTPSADGYDRYPRWPVVLLAAGAFVAIWGGWVDLGRMAGFGPVNLLPGIADFSVDLAITLPLGMEVYAAFALGVLLTHRNIRPKARKFAGVSVVFSLIIGAGGQVAYHLLSAAGVERAPWQVVVVVACVPVAVMGMGAALSHLLAPVPLTRQQRDELARAELAERDGMSPEVAELTQPEVQPAPHPEPALAPAVVPAEPVVSHDDEHLAPAAAPASAFVPAPPVAEPVVSHDDEHLDLNQDDDADDDGMDRDERDRRIVELAQSGLYGSERELAKDVPCSRSTVNRVLRRHNVVLDRQDDRVLVGAGER